VTRRVYTSSWQNADLTVHIDCLSGWGRLDGRRGDRDGILQAFVKVGVGRAEDGGGALVVVVVRVVVGSSACGRAGSDRGRDRSRSTASRAAIIGAPTTRIAADSRWISGHHGRSASILWHEGIIRVLVVDRIVY
jgi:hypothetical protein